MSNIPSLTLNTNASMPLLGLGVYKATAPGEVEGAIATALDLGYRLIDTASAYKNEEGVGRGIRSSSVPRKELFITTKLWNTAQRIGDIDGAFQRSLDRLGLDYVDLYLIHWASANYIETWKAMEEVYNAGKIKAIGVSNFQIHHLEDLMSHTEIIPMINQIETHPAFPQDELRAFMAQHAIIHEAWGPLGQGKNDLLTQAVLLELAEQYGKTPAQIVLRWHIERGIVVIPKSVTPSRIRENRDIFDFSLSKEDMDKVATLNTGERYSGNPDDQEFLTRTSIRPN